MTIDDMTAFTLPGRYYVSGEVFRAEQERIFKGQWLCAGRGSEIARPGDYKLVEVGVESLILVRGKDGVARALYNVCRHRGTRMCTAPQGAFASTIQCPYHAWTYDLSGRLVAARSMRELPGFDTADYPLHQAQLVEWEGFLMLNIGRELAPFDTTFAPLSTKFAPWSLGTLQIGARKEYDVKANWKAIIQNYSECYHCPLIHPALEKLTPSQSGDNDLTYGMVLGGYQTLAHVGGSMTMNGETARPALGQVAGEDRDRVYYYTIFPNLLLSLHADYVMTHMLWPLEVGRTRIINEFLFDPVVMAQPGFDPSDAVGFWDMTNRQDWQVCELTQLGVASQVYTPGPYAQEEDLLFAFDQEYLRVIEQGPKSD
jgi:Rieske 2Fe-2S family protein